MDSIRMRRWKVAEYVFRYTNNLHTTIIDDVIEGEIPRNSFIGKIERDAGAERYREL